MIKKYLSKLYDGLIISLITLMFLTVGINVFSRFVLNYSLDWADELPRYFFIWFSFLTTVITFKEEKHLGIDLLENKISNTNNTKIKFYFGVLNIILTTLLLGFLLYYGVILCYSVTNVSPILRIKMKYVFLVIPLSAILMLLINIKKLGFLIRLHCQIKAKYGHQ